jgi:hemolysin D
MERCYNGGALEAARSSAQDLRAIVAERNGCVQQWHADLADKLADAQGQLRKAQLRRQLVDLRADRDAIVLTIARASVGSVLQSGEQFITLMPADAPPEVAVNIPGNDAGYVPLGRSVDDQARYVSRGPLWPCLRYLARGLGK